jgi:hypothetical protein
MSRLTAITLRSYDRGVSALAKSSRAFRDRPLPVKAAAWMMAAFVFAVVGLAIEKDPVKESTARLNAYEREHGLQSAQRGGADAGGKGGPEVVGSAPVGVPGTEGTDKQLAAGATPSEVAGVKLPKGIRANNAGVRRLFAATLGSRGRVGQTQNKLVSVSCGAGRCEITYVPDGPGVGRVIETQGPLWGGLLSDPRWRSATITALPVKRGNGAKTVGGRTSITCTRGDVARVGRWGIQSTPTIRRLCRVR